MTAPIKAPPPSRFKIQDEFRAESPSSILLHGTFGSRKTSMALTASKFYPALPAQAPFAVSTPTVLKDTLLISWDRQAQLFAKKLGVWAPTIDMSIVEPAGLLDALNDVRAVVQKKVAEGVELIIVDTVSAFDAKLQVMCSGMFDKSSGENANQLYFRAILNTHSNEFQFLTSLKTSAGEPVRVIFTCHTTVKDRPPTKAADAVKVSDMQREVRGISIDGPQKIARVTGQAWEMYHNQSSLVLHIEKKKISGKEFSKVYPQGGRDSVSRDRGGVLLGEEDADFRVILPKYLNQP